MQTKGKDKRRQSTMSLFAQGFFSGMSFPVSFGTYKVETPGRREKSSERDIGKYFAKVGNMISEAYDREMEKAGIKR